MSSHVLVGAAVQSLCGQTWQEVRGNSRQEWTQPLVEPQLDDGRIIEAVHVEHVQSDFTNWVQNHRQNRVSEVQSLKEKAHPVSRCDQERDMWGVFLIQTLLLRWSRASSSRCEVLERRSFQTGLELLETEERLHITIVTRSSAFNADSWVMKERKDQKSQLHTTVVCPSEMFKSHRSTSKLLNSKVTEASTHQSTV